MAEQRRVHLGAAHHQDFPGAGRQHRFILLRARAKQRELGIVPGGDDRNADG